LPFFKKNKTPNKQTGEVESPFPAVSYFILKQRVAMVVFDDELEVISFCSIPTHFPGWRAVIKTLLSLPCYRCFCGSLAQNN